MKKEPMPRSIWDIDPRAPTEPGIEQFEPLFDSAYRYVFRRGLPPHRLEPYVQRYLRFRVVPPWVRKYVRDVLNGEAIANLGNAPLDPAIDLRLELQRLSDRVWHTLVRRRQRFRA